MTEAATCSERTLPDPTTEPTVTVMRTARILGISKSAAYDAVKNGDIPTVKIGRRLLVPSAALVAMLQDEGGIPAAS